MWSIFKIEILLLLYYVVGVVAPSTPNITNDETFLFFVLGTQCGYVLEEEY